jgi:hypothetical protein
MIRLGSQGLYVSMFDEFNEGNQIAKTAETAAYVPAGSGIRPLDEDGTACSADYYLRITGDGARMLKGQLALTATRPTQPVVGGPPPPPPTGDLAAGHATSASSTNGPYPAANAVDGNAGSYWESANNAFPQWLQVDLGAAFAVTRIVLKLPAGWGARTQTVTVQGSTDGSAFSTLAGSAGYTFDPAASNTVTVTVAGTARYVRLSFAANTGWPAAQLSQLEVYGDSAPPVPPAGDLARSRPTTESSHTQAYAAANAVDGNAGSYWESANNAFPQWLQVDLGAAAQVGRVVLKLPPSWGTRGQTLTVQGSTDGSTFSTLAASAARTFDPATGNQATLTFTAATTRYLRVTVTANTAWPAAQLSTLEAYAS